MEFRTIVKIPESPLKITHRSRLVMFGSCFTESIGNLLQDNKFRVNLNPFGILYNPASVSRVIRRIYTEEEFTEKDTFEYNGLYSSFLHHGIFSKPDKHEILTSINESLHESFKDLSSSNFLIITFGTSYVYYFKETGEVVSNCHKFPSSSFDRNRLSVSEIITDWKETIHIIRKHNPSINILFTVSPIRHWKDGAHENQLSKSTLLLAIDELQKAHENIFYFPSYEILMDELRDYRFYGEDMFHPSTVAVKYIWDVFKKTFFDNETESVLKQWEGIRNALQHRAFNTETKEHKQFLIQTLLKIDSFQNKYPYIDCTKEKKNLDDQLK